MFGIGSTELLVILLVALLVLGPKSLASFSSKLGKLLGEFRRASTDFQRTLNLEAAREEAREAEKSRSADNAKTASPEQEAKGESVEGQPTNEDLRKHGIPDDSPLALALKRAREQAESSGARNGEAEKDSQTREARTAAGKATERGDNDGRS